MTEQLRRSLGSVSSDEHLDSDELLWIRRFVKAARHSIVEEHAVIYASFK